MIKWVRSDQQGRSMGTCGTQQCDPRLQPQRPPPACTSLIAPRPPLPVAKGGAIRERRALGEGVRDASDLRSRRRRGQETRAEPRGETEGLKRYARLAQGGAIGTFLRFFQ